MKHLDKLSDVAVAPLVEKEFRRRRLFATSLHPTHLLLNHLLRQAKAWTLNQAAPAPAAFADDQDGEILGEEEIPVHPQIIAEFQLAWAPPDLKYRYRSRLLTFPEYLEAYIRFDLIPTGTTPQLLLERADQAYRHQQIAEAQRLLYQGLAQFPDEPLLVQPLATLLTESREFLKANYVLGCALARPGLEPALRAPWVNHLGITQYYLGNFAQAEASFREALQLQPGWVEAADNLQEVLKNRVI
jgi:tetratricopeptide (TPR) repeat protein